MTSCYKQGSLKACLLFMLTILNLHAFEGLELNSLNIDLNADTHQGRLSGEALIFESSPLKISSQAPDLFFTFKEGAFETNLEGINLAYDFGKESFLGGIKQISTENLDVQYLQDQRLRVENSGLLIGHSGGKQYIPSLTLTCAANPQKSLVSDLSNQCLHLARLKAPVLNFDQLSGEGVAKALGASRLKNSSAFSLDELEEIDLMIMNNAFKLSFKARLLFRFKIKASGSVQFDKENGVIAIHLEKARVGFISLKNRLLKELREGGFESITVSGDNIFIQI